MPDQSIGNTFHMPSYIRGNSYNGAISKDDENDAPAMQSDSMLNEFKNALRIIASDVSANKQHRNGDNGEFCPPPLPPAHEPRLKHTELNFANLEHLRNTLSPVCLQILVSLVLETTTLTRQQTIQ